MAIISGRENYGVAFLITLAVALLLWAPGLLWNALKPQNRLPTALIPLPGFLALVMCGVVVWGVHPTNALLTGIVAALPGCASALALIWRRVSRGSLSGILGDQGATVVMLWAALTIGAAAVGLNRLPVALELLPNTVIPGRIVASPPDHVLPYLTAVYFFHGHDGHAMSDEYFSKDWSVASRGPLVPLATLSLMHVFHAQPSDPPDLSTKHWPVTTQGAFIARMLGWMTNAFVVLAAGHLLRTLNVSARVMQIALAWTCLAPSVIQNTVFLWPKELAAFFILLAVSEIIRERWEWSGVWLALAWLSHPVGLLFAPGVGLFLLWQAYRRGEPARFNDAVAPALRFGLAFLAMALPWALYKAWLGRHDMFFDYLLGAGYVPERAVSFAAWAWFRWDNFWFTLVPGAFIQGPPFHNGISGPLSEIQRWNVQYSRTLPGSLGLIMFIPAYFALIRRNVQPLQNAIRICLVFIPLCVMIVYWGFSNDGLGRNSLEPLVPLIIVFAVAHLPTHNVLWNVGLASVWLEGRCVELSGMMSEQTFTWAKVPISSWVFWTAGGLASLFILRTGTKETRT